MNYESTNNSHSFRNFHTKKQHEKALRFIVMGDYGVGMIEQEEVATGLSNFMKELKPLPRFIISTGDQIYDHGITSKNDPLLQQNFESIYHHSNFQLPWYITIGNHDCEGSIQAMLDYAQQSSQWHFPKRYYYIDQPISSTSIIRIIVLDTCDIVCGIEPRNFRCINKMIDQTSEHTRKNQLKWLKTILKASKPNGIQTMWKIVVGHWSVYSYAGNSHTIELINTINPLLQRYHVHAYFNGHDHCLQHIQHQENNIFQWYPHYFVSGAGGYRIHELTKDSFQAKDLKFIALEHGFMSVYMNETLMTIQFVNKYQDILYEAMIPYAP